jgi:hypothetical protein
MMMRSCGAVWGNPGFFDLFPRLFDSGEFPGNKSLMWFKYLAPKLFDERLVKTIEAQSSQRENQLIFEVLVHKGRHNLGTTGNERIEFVVGRYKFPHKLQLSPCYTFVENYWVGTSILSFKGNGFEVTGDEGKYWLWLGMRNGQNRDIWRYQIMDYTKARGRDWFDGGISKDHSFERW